MRKRLALLLTTVLMATIVFVACGEKNRNNIC